jgi:hypothetical protein
VAEAAPRLDGRADDHELGSMLRSNPRDFLTEASRAGADDLPPHGDAVGGRERGSRFEPLLEPHELSVEMRVERQLVLEDGGSHQDDPSPAVGREPAREVERVLGLLPVEQRHDDAPVGDRPRPAREAPGAVVEHPEVGEPHRSSWYGTEARMTFGSTSSSRFT